MANFSERLKEALAIRHLTAAELSRIIGVNEGTISNYKKGVYEPKQRRLESIANALHVSIPWLMGADVPITGWQSIDMPLDMVSVKNIIPIPEMKAVPLLGTIACGEPILAEENIEAYINMPKEVNGTFALRCKGDSMINARIFDGDIVFIRQQPDVENGTIAAVLINDEATLKKVYKYPNRIELRAENPTMRTLEYEGEEMNNVHIIGKAVYFLSPIQ